MYAAAPYALGTEYVRALESQGGRRALRDQFRTVPTSDAYVFNPYSQRRRPWTVSQSPFADGETFLGDAGAVQVYLLLASRIGPEAAFAATDALYGAVVTTFTEGGTPCARVTLRTKGGGDLVVNDAVNRWVRSVGLERAGWASIEDLVVFESCAGATAVKPNAIRVPAAMLEARNRAMNNVVEDGHDVDAARCVGDAVLADRSLRGQYAFALGRYALGQADQDFDSAETRARTACNAFGKAG